MQPIGVTRTYLLNQVEFAYMLRRLFADYAHWTRELIVLSALESDTQAVQQRLRRNTEDLAGLVRQLYGERNAAQFSGILSAADALVLEWINAAKANDTQRMEELSVQWYAAADIAAQFISTLNSNFDQNEFQTIFYDLIYMTQNQIAEIFSGDYEGSIQQYDQIMDRLRDMAEDITFAVMRQFQI